MTTLLTKYNKEKYTHDGFSYVKDNKPSSDGQKLFWCCDRRRQGCKGEFKKYIQLHFSDLNVYLRKNLDISRRKQNFSPACYAAHMLTNWRRNPCFSSASCHKCQTPCFDHHGKSSTNPLHCRTRSNTGNNG